MFKKISFAAALAGTVLFGGTFASSASAQSYQGQIDGHHYKIYYSVNGNCDIFSEKELQQLVDQYLQGYQMDLFRPDTGDKNNTKQQESSKDHSGKEEQSQPSQPKQTADEEQEAEQSGESEQPEKEQVKQPDVAPAPAETKQPPKQQQPEQQQNRGYQLNQFEQKVVQLTNQERVSRGLEPLKVSLKLSKMARAKSADMARNNYFSHNSPTYGSPFEMMKQFGISYRAAGENIAKGQRTPQEVVNAWMNSAGHRRNILNPDFTHIGVGYVAEGNIWTQEFIGK